jgi:hypothetical protein
MTEKIPDDSELAKTQADMFRYLSGRIGAVAFLASALVARLAPDLAKPLLHQIIILKAKAKGETLTAYEQGYASVEATLLQALKTVEEAQQIGDTNGPSSSA